MNPIRKYLALGDSYTIGESVPPEQNFPNQLRNLLHTQGCSTEPPRIVAKTGWTTDELIDAIEKEEMESPISTNQDLVTLLIGVNNQYRGRNADEFAEQFRDLLERAIRYANNVSAHVRVLSIPDWGVTPYAEGRDRAQISREIDAFNARKERICSEMGVPYIYITDLTREAANNPALLTNDGLHPAGVDYHRWAERLWRSLKTS